MNRFKPSTPRVATAIAAVVMTVITFGLFIVVPATIGSDGQSARTQAANGVPPAAIDRVIIAPDVDFHHQG